MRGLLTLCTFLFYYWVASTVPNAVILRAQIVDPTSAAAQQQSCGFVLSIPKIALMFLSRGGMPLGAVWDHWLQPLAGLAPKHLARDALCKSNLTLTQCSTQQGGNALQRQNLFSFYVHSSLTNFSLFHQDEVFYGTMIPDLSKAVWGDSSAAVQGLMKAALKEQLNQRFVLLSDMDIPIYPARVIYAQLMSETLSRIAACQAFDMANINRYTCKMSENGVYIHHWRKNTLWFSLNRQHTEMIAEEEEVRQIFQEHCSGVLFDQSLGRYRGCLVDEHYYGTVFAKLGRQGSSNQDYHNLRENRCKTPVSHLGYEYLPILDVQSEVSLCRTLETDCKGIVSVSDISRSVRGHPKMYTPKEIDFDLVGKIRFPLQFLGTAHCANDTLWDNAKDQYVFLPEAIAQHSAEQCAQFEQSQNFRPMESWCQLFGRKFRADTSEAILAAFPGLDPRWSLQ